MIKLISALSLGGFLMIMFSLIKLPQNVASSTNDGETLAEIQQESTAAVKQTDFDQQDVDAIKTLLSENIEAASQENIEAYMNTIDLDSPNREQNRMLMEWIFNSYDLNYVLDSYEIASIVDDTARVKIVQTTTKIDGADFKDNRLTGVHILKKNNNRWKFFEIEIKNIEYLN